MMAYVLIGFAVWNVIVASIYGIDKMMAIKGGERISEFTLLFLAFAFAGMGALLGMVLWHHKTRKWKFKFAVPVALLWETFSIGYVMSYLA